MMEGRRGVERQVESGLRKGFTPRVIADNCVALEYLARSGVTASHPRNPIYCDVDKMATFSSIGREGEGGGWRELTKLPRDIFLAVAVKKLGQLENSRTKG